MSVHFSQQQLPICQPWKSKCVEATRHTYCNSESNRQMLLQLWRKGPFSKCLPEAMCSPKPNSYNRCASLHLLRAGLEDMHQGERVCIFALLLSSVANLHCHFQRHLEPKSATHSTRRVPFLPLPRSVGLSLC
jgi:hypothetical protein